jgi:C-3',4' desaturase CrtD
MRVVVVGAGVGGLTVAAVLARAGVDVEVLEAGVHPGGCAGTYSHQGYRFDVGATLAAGFAPGGPMDLVARATGVDDWPTRPADQAMVVHLPDAPPVIRWTTDRRFEAYRAAFGPAGERFWRWQERTADAVWALALRNPPWPPRSPGDAARVAAHGLAWLGRDPWRRLSPVLALDVVRPVASHLRDAPDRLRLFVDAQLLIAAQATSARANALYGAAALDLPRRGVVHVSGGMGAVASTLVAAIQRNGGRVRFRTEVCRIVMAQGWPIDVETARHETVPADVVVANLPPANLAWLFGDDVPRALRSVPRAPRDGWGAFTLHVGVDAGVVPLDFPLHHQVVVGTPLGEGNSVFLSLSPVWDTDRAPPGRRAITLSTHTDPSPWWDLHEANHDAYDARKATWTDRVLAAAEAALPGLRDAADPILPGTPVTFARFTCRSRGWVGGFPQTHLWRTRPPHVAPGVWMVGDSIFPGQSTAAVALGALRVAGAILRDAGIPCPEPHVVPVVGGPDPVTDGSERRGGVRRPPIEADA